MKTSVNTFTSKLKTFIYPLFLFFSLGRVKLDALGAYHKRNYASPSPTYVKDLVLMKWGGLATWVETGTNVGKTTELLANFGKEVFSIEPSKELFELAGLRLKERNNVTLVLGTSEESLGPILQELVDKGHADLSFWLDGHYSEGNTFRGENETSVIQELKEISKIASRLNSVSVMIDDVRCFRPVLPIWANYPDLNHLVNWANSLNLFWTIEHDIFIATNRDISLK